uniref:Transcription factor CBF/NF-Y/archaeal histone domain-containing protein n=1 Tax=Odontella aurita TaxID=265563 RepID=A0A7S4JRQ4_9STRA|mmetsp:Transcript_52619/g.157645  ORF Transcript_52619/g.157645 Transcript_52619/m.157645 type:complete len:199 (+) Transcript_52619:186-782(+)|eukprot:CAMPEP_0113563872 /NCGR_PEP_ID=MMETSP0015_2-20120614/21305_1 /TAXON_ID=2838 /ORGANISM="Odontella" /LENGTH=198 /DNA_ID=CAMNT_0000465891 /DNA_START=180 /DNA_END=776 /DNA_ORIENTATION=- /assembly_acc=CAM_ASM_000160
MDSASEDDMSHDRDAEVAEAEAEAVEVIAEEANVDNDDAVAVVAAEDYEGAVDGGHESGPDDEISASDKKKRKREASEDDSNNLKESSSQTPSVSDKPKKKKKSKKKSPILPGHTAVKGLTIPFRNIKRTMKNDKDIATVQNEAAIVATCAAELFIKKLAEESHKFAKKHGRNTIRYEDVAEARANNSSLEFLEILLP